MHVQKEAGILERGMQALKHAISSLLGQRDEDKPERQVAALLLALHHLLCLQRNWKMVV